MKKTALSLLIAMGILGANCLNAEKGHYDLAATMKSGFGVSDLEYDRFAVAAKQKKLEVSTSDFTYQYTNDGWLQQLAIYSNFIVGTNLAGPREGLQIIMWDNLAMDMCHSYKEHKNYISHKYSWGEIRTYKTYQTVIFN